MIVQKQNISMFAQRKGIVEYRVRIVYKKGNHYVPGQFGEVVVYVGWFLLEIVRIILNYGLYHAHKVSTL